MKEQVAALREVAGSLAARIAVEITEPKLRETFSRLPLFALAELEGFVNTVGIIENYLDAKRVDPEPKR